MQTEVRKDWDAGVPYTVQRMMQKVHLRRRLYPEHQLVGG